MVSLRLTWKVNTPIPEWFRQIKQLGLHLIDKSGEGRSRIIETIPDAIVNLENLVFLKILLRFSTDWLSWLKTLDELELDLSSNQLTNFPESLSNPLIFDFCKNFASLFFTFISLFSSISSYIYLLTII